MEEINDGGNSWRNGRAENEVMDDIILNGSLLLLSQCHQNSAIAVRFIFYLGPDSQTRVSSLKMMSITNVLPSCSGF